MMTPIPQPNQSAQQVAKAEQRVLEYLDDHANQIVTDLRDLVRMPSVSGSDEENSIQAVVAARLDALDLDVDHWQVPLDTMVVAPDFPGMEVERAEAWGVVGALRGTGEGPSLMLNGHVDVVPTGDVTNWHHGNPFAATVDADAVHGRGTCDMKGGLVAAMWAVRALARSGIRLGGDVVLASVQGEEDGGLGTYALLGRGWTADACIIPEPTSLDIAPANGGSLTFRLRIPGKAAHASRRTSGVSAIEKFWPVFAALRQLEAERNTAPEAIMARWDIAYPIEVGTVRAGDWASSVPDLLVAEGRFGVALEESMDQAREAFTGAVADACRQDPWLRDHPVEVEWWGGQFAPGRTALDEPIMTTLKSAHDTAAARPQSVWGAPYGSDLRLMTQLGGVPTVHYGPGDASLAHGPNEQVPIADVLTASRALALAAMRFCAPGAG